MLAHVQYTRKPSSKNLAWKFSLRVEEMGDLVVTKHRKVNSKPGDTGTIGEMKDMTPKVTQDVGHASMANGCSNGEESHCGHAKSAKSCADADGIGTNTGEFNMQGSRFDKVSEVHGIQELLQFAREFESEEALQEGSNKKSHSYNEGFKEGYPLERKVVSSSSVKEDVSNQKEGTEVSFSEEPMEAIGNHKEGTEVFCSEEAMLTGGDPDREVSGSYSQSVSKSDSKCDQRSLENRDGQHVLASVNRRKSKSPLSASITVGPSRSQFTIPQPFSLATDKRAQGGGRPRDAENGLSQKVLGPNGIFGDTCSRTSEILKKPGSRVHVEKSVCPENIKHEEDTLKKLSIHETPEQRDEDAMSISSTKSCSLAPKAKASRFTSTSSFRFQSDVRAEKRKEYYAKLQERLIAKEEEMNQLQAKAKKEREEEIKLLRKSLTFKAHPVPSFYQEGPPQKAQLPKIPTTRAKSPNFSRRESNFGGSTRLCNVVKCEADHRSSFSPQKPGKGCDIGLLGDDDDGKLLAERKFSAVSPKTTSAEANMPSSGSVSELLDAEFSVTDSQLTDVHVKVRDPLIVSSELMMSNEVEKVSLEQAIERKHANSNGGNDFYHDEVILIKSSKTSADIDSRARPDCQMRAGNVLQGQVNANAASLSSTCNNTKADKKAQPLVHEDGEVLCAKEGNQSTKKQRYKALTPYFRKQESRRDEGQAVASMEMPHVNPNLTMGSE